MFEVCDTAATRRTCDHVHEKAPGVLLVTLVDLRKSPPATRKQCLGMVGLVGSLNKGCNISFIWPQNYFKIWWVTGRRGSCKCCDPTSGNEVGENAADITSFHCATGSCLLEAHYSNYSLYIHTSQIMNSCIDQLTTKLQAICYLY